MAGPSETLKLALIGYGKMGRLVEKAALARNHQIVDLPDSDICIDFSHPDAVLNTLKKIGPMQKSVVIGTTGWHEKLPQVKELVAHYQIGCLHSANFSLGVNLFLQVVEEAAKRFLAYPDYDAAISESHHQEKKDAPSGTALLLAKKMGKPVEIASVRCGHIPGTHTVLFDSQADLITLTHEARSREGFALGAVRAAEWLQGKKGLFTMEDIFS